MKIPKHLSVHSIIFVLILLAAIYLRFVNFPLKYGFDFDPTRDALIVAYGASHFQFPLIGPRSGIGPFAFGPWYYYELIFFKLLLPVPYSPWIFIGIMSVLFVIVMYYIGKELEGKNLGLLLMAIAAFCPEQIGPTTGLSNPNLVPIHAALTVLFSILYLKPFVRHSRENGNLNKPTVSTKHNLSKDSGQARMTEKNLSWFWILVWGFILGVGINDHYQVALLLPLPAFAFAYKVSKLQVAKFQKTFNDFFLFTFGLIISFIPLIVYNLQHNFVQLQGFMFYLTQGRNATYIPNSWKIYLGDFWLHFLSMVFGIPPIFTILLLLLTILILVWYFMKKKFSIIYLFLFATFIIDFIFLRYFSVQRELYYFLFFHPFLFLFFGLALLQITSIVIPLKKGIHTNKFINIDSRLRGNDEKGNGKSISNFNLGWIIVILIFLAMLSSVLYQDNQRVSSRQDQMMFHQEAMTLENAFPNQDFEIYGCAKSNLNQPQGIVFFLNNDDKLDGMGNKILLIDNNCTTDYLSAHQIKYSNIKNMDAVIVNSNLPHSNSPWQLITPQTVYEITIQQ